MKKIYKGKTKDVYELTADKVLLQFKDDATGRAGQFDPGADTVGLSIPGSGRANVRMTSYFFEILKEKQIPTHFVTANIDQAQLTVKKAKMLGKGIEVIVRYYAVGSFLRRYGDYCKEHDPLQGLIEFTIKDDKRKDPVISKDILLLLKIISKEEYERIVELTKTITTIVRDEFKKRELNLYDIKLEFGRDMTTGEIMLIDEISAGNMRVYQNNKQLQPTEINKLFFM